MTLPYIETGDKQSTPVILLHGISDSHRSYERLLPHLPNSIHSFAVTLRGHGNASKPESGFSVSNMANDIDIFMDRVGIGKAVIVGHSMGSFVSQRLAIDHPERIEKLVLIGSFPSFRNNQTVIDFAETEIVQLEDPINPDFVREFQLSTLQQQVPADFLEMVVDESLKVPARVWKEAFGSMLEADHTPELGKITAETLLLWGDQDAYLGLDDQTKLLANISNSQLEIFEGVGHAPHWEQPEKAAAVIASFVGSVTLVKEGSATA